MIQATSQVSALLGRIPSTFWGVLAGSVFTLIGIYFTNRAQDKRADQDRRMRLRTEIYLAVVEALMAGANAIGSLANLDLTYEQVTGRYIEKAPAIAKAHLVATETTAHALIEIGLEISNAFKHLILERVNLMILKQQIDQIEVQTQSFFKVWDSMVEEMRNYNIEGIKEPGKFQRLETNAEFEKSRVEDARKEQQRLRVELRNRHTAYLRECTEATRRISDLVPTALISVRNELELSTTDEYIRLLRESQGKSAQADDAMFSALDAR